MRLTPLHNGIGLIQIVGGVDFWCSRERAACPGKHISNRAIRYCACPCSGNAICPCVSPVRGSGYFDFSAVLEHVFVAIIRQHGCRQRRYSCEAYTRAEHPGVATAIKRSCRQRRCGCEVRATGKHVFVAAEIKCSCRQGRCGCEALALGEHFPVAVS